MSYTFLSPVIGRTPDVPTPIRMYPVGHELYVAFCDDVIAPHYLEVAGTLYVFMQGGTDYSGVIDAVLSVLNASHVIRTFTANQSIPLLSTNGFRKQWRLIQLAKHFT